MTMKRWGPKGEGMSQNLYVLLASRFPADRSKPCFLMSVGSAVSYGELGAAVAPVAGRLVAEGVQPGDRVALQAEKSVAGVAVYLATLKAGAVFLPLNAAYTAAEVDYFLKDAEPAVFITEAEGYVAGSA